VGLTTSQIFATKGGDHMSAIDPANAELLTRIAAFSKSAKN
jgi:hypothetical protein